MEMRLLLITYKLNWSSVISQLYESAKVRRTLLLHIYYELLIVCTYLMVTYNVSTTQSHLILG